MNPANSSSSAASIASELPNLPLALIATIRPGVAALRSIVRDSRALNDFLVEVERRAFRIAHFALGHEQDALDVVQDAMLRLARGYGDRPAGEWRPLFHRILQNRIRDAQRRRKVVGRVLAFLPWTHDPQAAEDDPLQQLADPAPGPVRQLQGHEAMAALRSAVRALPDRQRQAFLLRSLEGLDVADTASAMGCSEGSVKTHHFRALQSLRARLGELADE